MKRSGLSLVEVLVASFLLAIVSLGMVQFVSSSRRAERGIASNADLSQIRDTVRMVLDGRDACRTSGLVGLTVDPSRPEQTVVRLRLPGTPAGPVVAEEGMVVNDTRRIERLRFTRLGLVTDLGTGVRVYFATLTLEAPVIGTALTTRNSTRDLYVRLVLDPSNVVADCY